MGSVISESRNTAVRTCLLLQSGALRHTRDTEATNSRSICQMGPLLVNYPKTKTRTADVTM